MQFSVCVVLVVLVGATAARSQSPDVPEANPGRPTVSTPATLTPVGYLQFENGFVFAHDSQEFSTQYGLNQVTKLTVHPRLQLILQSQPLAISLSDGDTLVQNGDVVGGVQCILYSGDPSRPTVAVSYFRRIYAGTALDNDIGGFRQSGLILVSGDLHGFHIDANGIVSEQLGDGLRRAQFGQTLSISHPLGKFTIAGEIWHFSQPFQHGDAVGNLWALSYPVRKNLVVDGGFNYGITSTSIKWEAFAGFTYLLPHRLWKSR